MPGRLQGLIARVAALDPDLGAELAAEVAARSEPQGFGLTFERRGAEPLDLPGRPIAKGDKVRILPPRGSVEGADRGIWRVEAVSGRGGGRSARLWPLDKAAAATRTVPVRDLVAVAEAGDTITPGLVQTGLVQTGLVQTGLVQTGGVERGDDSPAHIVINGENLHALAALAVTHRGRVDAIYIDPPYNTGARDWTYNNRFADDDDADRHSRWLAFMEARLTLARQLLRADNAALIVSIDEREVLRLGLLLEQVFPDALIQMISTVIKPGGALRPRTFARSDEYLFFVLCGDCRIIPPRKPAGKDRPAEVPWRTSLTRGDFASRRGTIKGGPDQFYPIFVARETGRITGFGEPLPPDADRHAVVPPPGCVAVFPVRPDGTEMNWGLVRDSARRLLEKGYLSAGPYRANKPQAYPIRYLTAGRIAEIESGAAEVVERRPDGSVRAVYVAETAAVDTVTTQWNRTSHSGTTYGTGLLKAFLGARRFPFPKSLYAVEDCLRYVVADKPNAVILDFFAGSGTTAHAVLRLNRQDGGRRQSISITRNEVAVADQQALRRAGLRPGDPDWESQGLAEHITKPRVAAAITGQTPEGEPVEGAYRFTDPFPMADGFAANAAFFTLTYERDAPLTNARAFARIAPWLWLGAGGRGRRIEAPPAEGWAVADTYGLLLDLDQALGFRQAVAASPSLLIAYVVTEDAGRFQAIAAELPATVEAVRLCPRFLV